MPATKNKMAKKRGKKSGLYMKSILTRNIVFPFNNLDRINKIITIDDIITINVYLSLIIRKL